MQITYQTYTTEDVDITTATELMTLLEKKDIVELVFGDYRIDGFYAAHGCWCYVYNVFDKKKGKFIANDLPAEYLVPFLVEIGAIKQVDITQK